MAGQDLSVNPNATADKASSHDTLSYSSGELFQLRITLAEDAVRRVTRMYIAETAAVSCKHLCDMSKAESVAGTF